MDKSLQESECTFCGSCVDACPVNALLEADRWRKGREWEYTKHNEIDACADCEALLSMPEFDVSYTNTGDSAAVDSSTTTV